MASHSDGEHTPRRRNPTRTGSSTNNPSRSGGSPTPQPPTQLGSPVGLAPRLRQISSWNTLERRSPLLTPSERPLGDNRRQGSTWTRRERPRPLESQVGTNRRGASSSTSRDRSSLPVQAGRLFGPTIWRVSNWNRSERSPLANTAESRLGTQSENAQTDFQNQARNKENISALRAHSPLSPVSPTPPITRDQQEAEDTELRSFSIQQRSRLEGPRPLSAKPHYVREPVSVNRPIMTDNQAQDSAEQSIPPSAGRARSSVFLEHPTPPRPYSPPRSSFRGRQDSPERPSTPAHSRRPSPARAWQELASQSSSKENDRPSTGSETQGEDKSKEEAEQAEKPGPSSARRDISTSSVRTVYRDGGTPPPESAFREGSGRWLQENARLAAESECRHGAIQEVVRPALSSIDSSSLLSLNSTHGEALDRHPSYLSQSGQSGVRAPRRRYSFVEGFNEFTEPTDPVTTDTRRRSASVPLNSLASDSFAQFEERGRSSEYRERRRKRREARAEVQPGGGSSAQAGTLASRPLSRTKGNTQAAAPRQDSVSAELALSQYPEARQPALRSIYDHDFPDPALARRRQGQPFVPTPHLTEADHRAINSASGRVLPGGRLPGIRHARDPPEDPNNTDNPQIFRVELQDLPYFRSFPKKEGRYLEPQYRWERAHDFNKKKLPVDSEINLALGLDVNGNGRMSVDAVDHVDPNLDPRSNGSERKLPGSVVRAEKYIESSSNNFPVSHPLHDLYGKPKIMNNLNGAPTSNGAAMPINAGQQMDVAMLYQKIQELSKILQENRQRTRGVIQGAETLATRAASNGAIPSIQEANAEVSASRIAALTKENHDLRIRHDILLREQRENTKLIGEYETELGNIVALVRNFSYAKDMEKHADARRYNAALQEERDAHLQTRLEKDEWFFKAGRYVEMLRHAYTLACEEHNPTVAIVSGLQNEVRALRSAMGMEAEVFEEETGFEILKDVVNGAGEP